jgi:imidazoleglycerol phosphate dehydratase HisB
MVKHFFATLADAVGAAIHVEVRGDNTHHMVEACFKAVGRCLRQATQREGTAMPSTKGMLA